MRNARSIALVSGVAALLVVLYWLRLGGDWNDTLRSVLYAGVPWIAVVTIGMSIRAYGEGPRRSQLLLFWFAVLSYAIAEAIWVWDFNIARITPFPSVADVFYLLSYPLFLSGIVLAIRLNRVDLRAVRAATWFLFGIIVLCVAFIVLYFGVSQGLGSDLSPLGNAIMVSYSVGDIALCLLALGALVLALEYRGGHLMRFWLMMLCAFGLVLVADIGYSAYYDRYVSGDVLTVNVIESIWIFSYVFFALAGLSRLDLIRGAIDHAKGAPPMDS